MTTAERLRKEYQALESTRFHERHPWYFRASVTCGIVFVLYTYFALL